ncbi:triple gene block protein 2 [Papaya mosaic virus]|uniref:Movement protein TGB2 n=2 Tax=Papaya mosaic potexvirus TaxID=12181 RepID=TGB2_PMV|nr:triple gene block protein 2 [Papaya mosaic virus]P20953.1 RecName: Full=Movement protein TGB2; AltName: Full=12 kDa protein; AltName: Full=Triple gene block 2 protein; Short=TGBp2 [Papaya mosaic virus]AFV46463.1 triple gene block protein 2 [Papaya mosaic virus]BAA03052.1 unnamed protein product [Papaya mosaic virus]
MSSHQNFLTPPPDHSKAILAVAVGVGLAIVLHFSLSYKLPSPGDNIHSLPFGGTYRDGTKSIIYNSPHRGPGQSGALPIITVFAIIECTLHVLRKRDNPVRPQHSDCPNCS